MDEKQEYAFGNDPPPPDTPTAEEILRQVGHLCTAFYTGAFKEELDQLMQMYDKFLN